MMQYLAFARRFGDHPGGRGAGLFVAILVAILAGALAGLVAAFALRRFRPGTAGPAALSGPSTGGAAHVDQALAELRLRYARGEMSRDDYLRIASDLGAPVAPPPTAPPPAAAPPGG